MALPDFLIIGAMKCGTSTLATQLGAQSGVFMTTPKEPNFFSDDPIYAKGLEWYERLFDPAETEQLKGEASTHYTKLPTYPETLTRLKAALPAPKLVYMIRNPLQRAISHYIHEWTEARMGNDPVKAFAEHQELIDYSLYSMQIRPYLEAFGTDAVLLTSLEQIKADPHAAFAEIAAHLGLPPGAAWHEEIEPQNVSADRARRIPFQGLLIDNPVAKILRQTFIPKSLRTRVRNTLTMSERPDLPEDLIDRLKGRFVEDRHSLSQQFPDHTALRLCYPFADQ